MNRWRWIGCHGRLALAAAALLASSAWGLQAGGAGGAGGTTAGGSGGGQFAEVIAALNDEPSQRISEARKSWKRIFDAYIDMTAPPFPVGPSFNVATIHPKMEGWDKVAAWAEANGGMAKALHEARETVGFALPYGEGNVDARYRDKGLVVRVGVDGDLRRIEFPYLQAVDVIAAYATAEMYRRLEAGQPKEAFEVAVDAAHFLRQLCDRVMLEEKSRAFTLLSETLAAQRDAMYNYLDAVPVEVFREIAIEEYPFLSPGRPRLEMPEGEKIVAEALLRQVFDERGQADPERFAEVFGELQAKDRPLTQFGAARRWKNIAGVHGSLDASLKKLTNIYDDWWRRWRMRQYDPMMDLPTELSRTNPIRYGAVVWSIADIQDLFEQRKRLIAEVNGAAMAAGLAGYRKEYGADPDDREKAYATFVRKASDVDPWAKDYGRFLYRYLGSQRHPVDTPEGRVWVEGGVLYARGQDLEDSNLSDHTPDGSFGDMVIWPPVRALERRQGLVE